MSCRSRMRDLFFSVWCFLTYDICVIRPLLYSGHKNNYSGPTVGQKERENTMTMTMDLTGIVFYAANFMKKEMAR